MQVLLQKLHTGAKILTLDTIEQAA
jgi:hypothetical protein